MKKTFSKQGVYKWMRRALMWQALSVFSMLSFAGVSYDSGQGILQKKISLQVDNMKIKNVLKIIEQNAATRFGYQPQLIDSSRTVSLMVEDTPVINVLNMLFDSSVKFEEIGGMVIFKPAKSDIGILVAVSGKVTDVVTGESLPGVNVVVKGTANGTGTDADGKYTLQVDNSDAVLVFTFIGYTTQEIPVNSQAILDVQLAPENKELQEVVVVGYGTQKKGSLTGSVSSVKGDELTKSPGASTINTLAGRLPGLISQQSSGQPGSDQAAINIRGFGNALWIVDGIESDFNNIDPNQIESISILKDGSASIYGSRAGNGVILVTTKRGKDQKPVITINSSYSLQGITAMAKPTGSGQFAEMENEKYANRGLAAPYSAAQVEKYYNGTDPQYPNTNWFKETIRDWSPQQQHNLSVQGGSDKIKYYGFIGYLNQESLWKSNGGKYSRYNFQSNIDAKITEDISIQLTLSSITESRKFSRRPQSAGINTLWQDLWNSLPIYPASLPDRSKHSYANGQGVGSIKLISDYDIAGYDLNDNQNFKGIFVAHYNIRPVPGLSAKAFINYEKNYRGNKFFSKPYDFYTYDFASKQYARAGALGTQARLALQNNEFRNITGQFSLSYERALGDEHHITALALYEAIDYNTDYILAGRDNFITPSIEQLSAGAVQTSQANSSATEMGRAGYVGRLNYSYKNKYMFETSFRADASAKFPPNRRRGYFPGVSIGWRMEREDFLKNSNVIDELKWRVSYGSSGLDDIGNFQYLAGYKLEGQWLIGSATQVGLASAGLANPNLTWEKIKIYNFGTDFSLFGGKLFGSADVFYRTLDGIPATRILSLPNTFGATLPPENLNSQSNRGFEFSLGTSGSAGELKYQITGNISWSRAKWGHYEEQNYTDPDQKRILQLSGKWTDIQYGYKSDGLFTGQDEISNLKFTYPAGNASLRPGDIKYVDVNGDGQLNYKDQIDIGKGTTPHWMGGTTLNLQYKNFHFSSLFQGAFGYYNYITLLHGNLNYTQTVYDLRWSPQNNAATAFYPRLGGSSTNNFVSDHYYKKAGYIRLKTLSVGYDLPRNLTEKYKLQKLRVYVATTNLLTFNRLKEFDVDPEAPSGNAAFYYPQMRTISLGVNLSF